MDEKELKDLINKIRTELTRSDNTSMQIEAEIEKLYSELRVFYNEKLEKMDYSTVKEYCDSEQKIAKESVLQLIENRKDNQLFSLNSIINGYDESKTDEENFAALDSDNKDKRHIEVLLDDYLMGVIKTAARVMNARGYRQDLIDDVEYEARARIKNRLRESAIKIDEIFKEDQKDVIEIIKEEYETVMGEIKKQQVKQEEYADNEETGRTAGEERKEFADSLDAHISLEDQNNYAKDILKKKKENDENREKTTAKQEWRLPDDIF